MLGGTSSPAATCQPAWSMQAQVKSKIDQTIAAPHVTPGVIATEV
jgi:hypothetical protein